MCSGEDVEMVHEEVVVSRRVVRALCCSTHVHAGEYP